MDPGDMGQNLVQPKTSAMFSMPIQMSGGVCVPTFAYLPPKHFTTLSRRALHIPAWPFFGKAFDGRPDRSHVGGSY
jgi:hypothetical protein